MWQFTFEAPVGTRVLKRCFGVTTYGKSDVWFCDELDKWLPISEVPEDYGASSNATCRSFKAFKRHLRKHPELKTVDEVVLTSRFIGHNITARWVE